MDNKVQCITKNQRLEGRDTVTDVTFQPFSGIEPMNAQGAAIGTPNAPNPTYHPTEQSDVVLNSGFGLTIRNKEEADKYEVGQLYLFLLTDGSRLEKSEESAPKQKVDAQQK